MKQRLETVWLGRGGQGIVTATYVVAKAAIRDGYYAVSNPEFGAERRGSPVKAFLVIDVNPIRDFIEPIKMPHVIVALDDKLILGPMRWAVDALRSGGYLIVSTARRAEELKKEFGRNDIHYVVVDGIDIARRIIKRDIPNGPVIGAFIRALGFPTMESIKIAFVEQFDEKIGSLNYEAVREAFNATEIIPPEEVIQDFKPKTIFSTTSAFLTGDYPSTGWKEVYEGGLVFPGSSLKYKTGGWRVDRPVIDDSKCILCRRCWLYCPDGAVREVWEVVQGPRGRLMRVKRIRFDYDFCKGCWVCAEVCPTGAIKMVREV